MTITATTAADLIELGRQANISIGTAGSMFMADPDVDVELYQYFMRSDTSKLADALTAADVSEHLADLAGRWTASLPGLVAAGDLAQISDLAKALTRATTQELNPVAAS